MLHMMVFMGLWLVMGVQPSAGEGSWEGAGGGLCGSAGGPRNLTLSGGPNATQLLLFGCAEPATWDDAEGWCVERGGHLPSVRSARELLLPLVAVEWYNLVAWLLHICGCSASGRSCDFDFDLERCARSQHFVL